VFGSEHPLEHEQQLGLDYHTRQASFRREITHRVGKLGALGFEVTLCRAPNPNQPRRATP
jgi:hypothetical protein